MSMNGFQAHGDGPRRMRAALLTVLLLAGSLAPVSSLAGADGPPAGTRTLYLIRHGAYDEEDPRDPEVGRALTERGASRRGSPARGWRSCPRPSTRSTRVR